MRRFSVVDFKCVVVVGGSWVVEVAEVTCVVVVDGGSWVVEVAEGVLNGCGLLFGVSVMFSVDVGKSRKVLLDSVDGFKFESTRP